MKKVISLFLFLLSTIVLFAQVDSTAVVVKATFKENVLGNLTTGDYTSAFFFAFIGLFISQGILLYRDIKKNPDTPDSFSMKYGWEWIKHNLYKTIFSVFFHAAVIFVALRFSVDWFGYEPTMGVAFVFGLGFDLLVEFLNKKKKNIKF